MTSNDITSHNIDKQIRHKSSNITSDDRKLDYLTSHNFTCNEMTLNHNDIASYDLESHHMIWHDLQQFHQHDSIQLNMV